MKFWQKMFFFLPLVLNTTQAEMIDTFQFHHEADRIRAVNLAKSLRCLQCQNQNLVESNATTAYKLRLEVYEMVNQGKSDNEIIETMTTRFGHFVHYRPPFNPQTWVLWGLPIGLLLVLFSAILWRTHKHTQKSGIK